MIRPRVAVRPMPRACIALLLVAIGATSLTIAPAGTSPSAPRAHALEATASLEERGAESWRPSVGRARRYANRRAGDVRFAIVDLKGRPHKFHAGRSAPAASVFKAMLLVTYLRMVRDRSLHERDRNLLAPMIRRSDDVAATRVRDIVGRGRIERVARKAKMRHFRYHDVWGLSRTSARDQALFFYRLERYVPTRHEDYARRLLSSIVPSQRWGIAAVRPRGWKLFFKGGWATATGRVNHQVAFLERGRWRVAVAILTEFSPSHNYASKTLEGVAKRLLRGLPR